MMREKMMKMIKKASEFVTFIMRGVHFILLMILVKTIDIMDDFIYGSDSLQFNAFVTMGAIESNYGIRCGVTSCYYPTFSHSWIENDRNGKRILRINRGRDNFELFENSLHAFLDCGTRGQIVPGTIDISRVMSADKGRKYRIVKMLKIRRSQLSETVEKIKEVVASIISNDQLMGFNN